MRIEEVCFAAIDFESSGLKQGGTEVPVQVGIATWRVGEEPGNFFMSYLSAPGELREDRRRKHGIAQQQLLGAPALLSLWPQIKELLGERVLVAHGHGTEKRFLRAFPGHGFGPWVDTLSLSRAAWPGLESHALGDVCECWELELELGKLVPGQGWHDALYDAVGSLLVVKKVIESLDLSAKGIELLLSPDLQRYHQLRHMQ